MRLFAEADAADAELTEHTTRTPADVAAGISLYRKLGFALLLLNQSLLCQKSKPPVSNLGTFCPCQSIAVRGLKSPVIKYTCPADSRLKRMSIRRTSVLCNRVIHCPEDGSPRIGYEQTPPNANARPPRAPSCGSRQSPPSSAAELPRSGKAQQRRCRAHA